MAFAVIEYKSLGPVDVGLLSAVGLVLEMNCVAHLVEQLLWSLWHAKALESGFAQGAELWYNAE